MKRNIICMFALGWIGIYGALPCLAQEASETVSPLQAEQRQIIAKLSGAALPSRSTRAQRAEAADILVGALEDADLPVQRHRYGHPNIHLVLDIFVPPMRGQNIISHIPATVSSERYIVIGAHYDSVLESPGADDNGSGVTVALSLAKALGKLDSRNAHFLIVFFDQEEDGSAGSQAYVRKLAREDINVESMHNIDMIGWDGDGDRTMEVDLPTDAMEEIYRAAATPHQVDIARVTYNSADHLSFRNAGIEAICVSEEYVNRDFNPNYHKPSDTIDALNFDFMESSTLVLIDVMTRLTTRP